MSEMEAYCSDQFCPAPDLVAAAEAKGYKRGLLVGAREAEADADRFAIYEAAWIEAHNHARFRGASEEAQENIGRLLTWREAAATLRAQADRLRALAEKPE